MPRKRQSLLASQVGARVRFLRMERGLSIRRLAERAAVPESFITAIERGEVVFSVVTLSRLAEGLKVLPLDLLNHDTTTEVGDIVDMTRTWKPRTIHHFVKLLQGLAGRTARSRSSRPSIRTKHKRAPLSPRASTRSPSAVPAPPPPPKNLLGC